jgi:RNA polymerase sigma-70 factor, ECF subfamily
MSKTNATEEESWLVLRAQTGDHEALDALLKRVQTPLFRYIQSLVTETALAEDVLQEVFLRMYRKLHWLREPELFRPWAYRIATNEAFRQLKRQRLWSERMGEEELLAQLPALPTHTSFAAEWAAQLPHMIAALSPASRAVIALYYLHELSLEEVAAVLEIPVGTVKSRLAYGLSQLRKQMKGSV